MENNFRKKMHEKGKYAKTFCTFTSLILVEILIILLILKPIFTSLMKSFVLICLKSKSKTKKNNNFTISIRLGSEMLDPHHFGP